jgi:DNA-binding NarL/FixJ family response regulator
VLLLGTEELGWSQLRAVLLQLPDLRAVEAISARQAVAAAAKMRPEIIFIAPTTPGAPAPLLIEELHSASPNSHIVLFAAGYESLTDEVLLPLGEVERSSCLVWSELTPRGLRACVEAIIEAPIRLGNERTARLFFEAQERHRRAAGAEIELTEREAQVLRRRAAGLTLEEIAETEHLIPFPLDSVMNLGCARFATGRDAWRNRPGRV